MKKPLHKSTKARFDAASHEQLAKRDKRRMIFMAVGLVAVGIAFTVSRFQEEKYRADSERMLPETPVVERVEVPEIDVARLDELVSDSTDADRVLLERDAVDALHSVARNLTAAHFEAMGMEELDAARIDELLADPGAARGHAFSARGWIARLQKRQPGGGRPDEIHGRLVLEDESSVYFIVSYMPDDLVELEYGRVDGLFLKAFNDEVQDDTEDWVQGPLLVGPEILRSYAPVGIVKELPPELFLDVTDDDVEGGISGLPKRPWWTLLAYARDNDLEAAAWESAPVLDNESAIDMLRNGSEWRLQPFRLPPTKLMGVWTRRPGENPARLEEITEGWIGSWTWTGEAKVLRFALPEARPDLKEGHLVQGRGYFLKNLAYSPRDGGMRLASMVVLDELERFIPAENKSIEQIWIGVIVGVTALSLFIVLRLVRDRRRSKEIYEKLAERRRARRNRAAEDPAAPAPSSGT